MLAVLGRRHARGPWLGIPLAGALPAMVPKRFRSRLVGAARAFVAEADRLLADRRRLRDCAKWAIANWCFDAASLWCFLAAFGVHLDPVGTVVAYAVANTLGALPITPGGLGVVEGSLIPSPIAFGGPAQAVLLSALSWRLIEFWVPIPLGGLAYVSLRVHHRFAPLPVAEDVQEPRL